MDAFFGGRSRFPQSAIWAPVTPSAGFLYHARGTVHCYMGGCQYYGPFLGTLNIRGRTIMGTQKGTIILTTTHIYLDISTHYGTLV